jgi:hypothetical protein
VRAPSSDPACPSTAEQVLVHGANAVCGVPEPHAAADHHTALALTLSLGVAIAFAYTLVRRRGLTARRVAVLVLVTAAIAAPGLRAVWLDRGDAPLRAQANAKQVASLVDAMDSFAADRDDCLEAVHNECVACQPLVRFVLPSRTSCAHPRGRIELGPDALDTGCTVRGETLECGRSTL